jgi:hypothetical protein
MIINANEKKWRTAAYLGAKYGIPPAGATPEVEAALGRRTLRGQPSWRHSIGGA